MRLRVFLLAGLALVAAPAMAAPGGDSVKRIADDLVAAALENDPFISYFTGLPVKAHDRLPDNSPAALARAYVRDDALLARLDRIDADALTDPVDIRNAAIAREMLEAGRGLRVCRAELWSLSHMFGWPSQFPVIAERQPVASVKDRADALARWGSVPRYLDGEIANLRRGLAAGYSVPKPVAQRVLVQVEGLIAASPDKSAFYSPATRAGDAQFSTAFARLITARINPALARFRDFLRSEYIPAARDTLGLAALPKGRECYNASLRQYTTLDRPAEEVRALGEKTVAANVAEVEAMGRQIYGTATFAETVARISKDPANHFAAESEILAYSREMVEKGRVASARVIDTMPAQPLEVRPVPQQQRDSGVSTHYLPEGDPKKPAQFMLQIGKWEQQLRSDAAITALHEGYPGHHLQIAYALALPGDALSKLAFNSAYAEGWARYAEMLSEELGLLDDPRMKIARRAWPARGMVADPALHLFGWTREQTTAYLGETGRFPPEQTADLIDRMASLPGQLTAYDSGGLEIRALREQAKAALGDRFDLRAFHRVVLGSGVVPLKLLRRNVEAWIAAQR